MSALRITRVDPSTGEVLVSHGRGRATWYGEDEGIDAVNAWLDGESDEAYEREREGEWEDED